ncbi:SGNH hydrolase-type esterase domain-containing protein [Diplogelasinospora grovesii]|uniref:SGNH hydrolase-type esterase domain-containing protein n=1 Tax=Diplogelasinospora grovesii TaxID=303347 RepID=A0AAN6N680_9PEZI|nr:SGNH hydrolase-type esterase domain-containing protein [Diplogelasinospora grovesii]
MTGFVAFGDSYSAGIGTAFEGKENDCRQGNGAYPYLINADLASAIRHRNDDGNGADGNRTTTSFQWLSCTGSVTEDLLSGGESSQIDTFNASLGLPLASPDFATLSIGGNDLGFFDVMNACIFRFYSFYSGTCEAALAASDLQIQSPEFELRLMLVLMEILDKVRWETKPYFTITVTGYARFFNAETEACDEYSLGVWWGGIRAPKLKRDVRQRMNELVLAVNLKLKTAVETLNRQFLSPKVLFVDYDRKFEGHRFCEEGIKEPDYNRTETWFFLPGGPDNAPGTPQVPDMPPPVGVGVLEVNSPLVDPETCWEAAEKRGDWGEKALCLMAMAKHRDPTLRLKDPERFTAQNSMWYVPTYYGKTFHPRALGHKVMRDEIYRVWEEQGII